MVSESDDDIIDSIDASYFIEDDFCAIDYELKVHSNYSARGLLGLKILPFLEERIELKSLNAQD